MGAGVSGLRLRADYWLWGDAVLFEAPVELKLGGPVSDIFGFLVVNFQSGPSTSNAL